MAEQILYSDIRQKETYNQPMLYNIRAIHQSIMNILVTSPGERLFLPTFGVGLRKYLFRFPTDDTEQEILDNIVDQITRWETRVKIVAEQSTVYFDENKRTYFIKLFMNVPALGVTGYSITIAAPLEL